MHVLEPVAYAKALLGSKRISQASWLCLFQKKPCISDLRFLAQVLSMPCLVWLQSQVQFKYKAYSFSLHHDARNYSIESGN